MRQMVLITIAALLLTAVPALADYGGRGDWELGLYGGYGWLDDYGEFHPKSGPALRRARRLLPHAGPERRTFLAAPQHRDRHRR
jgi:hypothetical protein